jgi:DNA-directed RNA polymerase subunit RPC12/RpoP
MMNSDIKVKCKRCGRSANSTEFVIDPVYRMAVCPACVKERKQSLKVKAEIAQMKGKKEVVDEKKPAGWDKEDAYLEKAYTMKMQNTVKVEKIDDEKVKYKCAKCSYDFVYNAIKNTPSSCPYCGAKVSKIRF